MNEDVKAALDEAQSLGFKLAKQRDAAWVKIEKLERELAEFRRKDTEDQMRADKRPFNAQDKGSVCREIAADMERDASEFDGKPFTGRTVAEYFGNQGAAIAALALIVEEMLPRFYRLPEDFPKEGQNIPGERRIGFDYGYTPPDTPADPPRSVEYTLDCTCVIFGNGDRSFCDMHAAKYGRSPRIQAKP